MDPLVALALKIVIAGVDQALEHLPQLVNAINASGMSDEAKKAALEDVRRRIAATEAKVAAVTFFDDVPPPPPTRPG